MRRDDIISYAEIVKQEGAPIQRGMTFGGGRRYSVLLASSRRGAPYRDHFDSETGLLTYEGHDVNKSEQVPDPKSVDQPMNLPSGKLTENGKFLRAVLDYKDGLRKPELVRVYEKIDSGVWSDKGFFELVDAEIVHDGKRNVFRFRLRPVERRAFRRSEIQDFTRLIPTEVKVEVWRRDKGRCVLCGSAKHLHYDHHIPFSKGGASVTAQNIRLLCAKCNLSKGAKIVCISFVGLAA